MPDTASGTLVPPVLSTVPPSISVIITAFTFERLPSIEETIESLRSQTVAPAETILVIDHAPELQEECARRWPDVRVIPNRHEPGSCGGRNTGVAESEGEIVAFLDDDAVPGHDWIERLGAAYADPRVLSVGGGVRPRWLTERPQWFPPEFDWIVGCVHTGMPKELAPVRNVIIANMSVRRDAMIEVGGLRQEFSRIQKNAAGAEETDLCIRLRQRWPDGLVLYDPAAAVEHLVPTERTRLKYFVGRCFAEGRSKAALTQMVGSDSGLSAERSYVRRTLPLGVLRNLGSLFRGDFSGVSRAAMIGIGLAVTAVGYVTAPRAKQVPAGADPQGPASDQPPSPEFAPVRMDEVELAEPLPVLPPGASRSGAPFASSLCLVRLHGQPLGLIEVDLPEGGVPAIDLAGRIAAELGYQVESHLLADGLPAAEISADGIGGPETPRCLAKRDVALADPPSLSVVICTRNRPESVRITLRSILACDYPDERWEVIVVDNASEADPSIAAAAEEADGRIRVRSIHEPVAGLSNARNCGLRAASSEIVVFADDDVEVDRNWLRVLAAPFREDERVGASSGLTLPGAMDTPVQRWTEGFGGRVRALRVRRFDLAEPPPDRPLFPFTVGEFGAGRNMAFRRELLERLGGFDPALGPGSIAHDGDDIEALLRVILAGNAVLHDPAAIVWHAHPDDYRELEDRVWGYGIGFTACLTKAIIDHPSLLLRLARKLPGGIAFAISPNSEKNRGRQGDFPRSLARRELLGMAYGPIAYLRSRRASGRRLTPPPARSGGPTGPLRVLIVTDEYKPVIGGAARSAELLSHHMAGLGHTVAVATAWQPETPACEQDGDVEVHRVRDTTSHFPWLSEDPLRHHAPPFPDPEAVAKLRRLIDDYEPDLVHAYGWLANSAAAAMLGRELPLLISARDYGNVCANFTLVRRGSLCSGPAPAKCLSCASTTYGPAKGAVASTSVFGAKPLLRRKVTAIHSVSRFIAAFMDENLHVPNALSVTIPNFHVEEPGVPEQEILDQLPSEPFILFVGHLRGYKGIHQLLAAYEQITDPPPLVLVGTKGPDTPSQFPDGVTVLTYVPHATVMAMWDRALFGVFPSIAPEALGNVVHEAMSEGRATIGTRPGGHEDMIVEGETGLLVPGGDTPSLAAAMSRLIGDDDFRERLGRNAEKRAERYTPAVVMPQMEHLYYDTIRHFEQSRA